MVERLDRSLVNTFYAAAAAPGEVDLGADAAHHARVKRLSAGDPVTVTDGEGHLMDGRIASLSKNALRVELGPRRSVGQPFPIHLYVPVADRDRMLWLAEKVAELQVATWNPVMFSRSKSVTPRGEGEAFERKVRARMISALEQSGSAWLPEIWPTIEPEQLRVGDADSAFVLDRGGPALVGQPGLQGRLHIVVGPEGGFVPRELEMLRTAGWRIVSIGSSTLRFETAAIAAVAIARGTTMHL